MSLRRVTWNSNESAGTQKEHEQLLLENEKPLKFGDEWIKDWESEFNISLRKPNKHRRRTENQLQDYLQNIWPVQQYFIEKYNVDPPIINVDQMSLHRNELSEQKTLTFKNVVIKENHMLSREHITCYTTVSSCDKIKVLPEFVFKGAGTQTTVNASQMYPTSGPE